MHGIEDVVRSANLNIPNGSTRAIATQFAVHCTPSIWALIEPFETQVEDELGVVGLHAPASSTTNDNTITFHLIIPAY